MELEEKNKTQPHLEKLIAWREVITFLHGAEAYEEAQNISKNVIPLNSITNISFGVKVCFEGVPSIAVNEDLNILDALTTCGAAKSKREARGIC